MYIYLPFDTQYNELGGSHFTRWGNWNLQGLGHVAEHRARISTQDCLIKA